jgi:D-aspartate ligase
VEIMTSQPPALVIGGELNGLGVCRSLAQAGIKTYVLDSKWHHAALWSRYAIPIKADAIYGSGLLSALHKLDLPEHTELIITDEMAVYTISECRADLAFRIHLPPHDMVLTLQDKALFHKFATAHGLPVPNAVILDNDAEVSSIRDLRFPVVIKPADKLDLYMKRVSRIVLAHNPEQAIIVCQKILKTIQEVIVQEYIEGPDSDIYFCLFYRKGNFTKAMFTGQKLVSIPSGIGSTGFCVEVPPGDLRAELEDLTEKIIELSNYAGLGSVEYKWDTRAARFLIIEPTVGRTDWQEEIATLSGTNIPVIGYCEECNLPLPASKRISGVVWQQSYIDRIRARLGTIPRKATVVDGYWRWTDPVPAIIHYPIAIMQLFRR